MAIAKFWLSAFIPGAVLGYTQTIMKGPLTGKTAVPLPGLGRILNMRKSSGDGYMTDQRSFSTMFNASARMKSWADVDVLPTGLRFAASNAETSGTTEVDITAGTITDKKMAIMTRCRFNPMGASSGNSIVLDLVGAANDPCVSGSADIDYVGKVTFTKLGPTGLTVKFDGKIDAFPAFEAYVQYNGIVKALFTEMPLPGKTVVNLVGPANRPFNKSVSF